MKQLQVLLLLLLLSTSFVFSSAGGAGSEDSSSGISLTLPRITGKIINLTDYPLENITIDANVKCLKDSLHNTVSCGKKEANSIKVANDGTFTIPELSVTSIGLNKSFQANVAVNFIRPEDESLATPFFNLTYYNKLQIKNAQSDFAVLTLLSIDKTIVNLKTKSKTSIEDFVYNKQFRLDIVREIKFPSLAEVEKYVVNLSEHDQDHIEDMSSVPMKKTLLLVPGKISENDKVSVVVKAQKSGFTPNDEKDIVFASKEYTGPFISELPSDILSLTLDDSLLLDENRQFEGNWRGEMYIGYKSDGLNFSKKYQITANVNRVNQISLGGELEISTGVSEAPKREQHFSFRHPILKKEVSVVIESVSATYASGELSIDGKRVGWINLNR